MVLLWIGIGLGVLIVIILVIKAIKTPSHDVLRIEPHCKKCGLKTNGLKCSKCEKETHFGV